MGTVHTTCFLSNLEFIKAKLLKNLNKIIRLLLFDKRTNLRLSHSACIDHFKHFLEGLVVVDNFLGSGHDENYLLASWRHRFGSTNQIEQSAF
jgi:hypothetical protein